MNGIVVGSPLMLKDVVYYTYMKAIPFTILQYYLDL